MIDDESIQALSDSNYSILSFDSNISAVVPTEWTVHSQQLSQCLLNIEESYHETDIECTLACGNFKGNLILVPCGHSDYCFGCMQNWCQINDRRYPRRKVLCPECGVEISTFVTLILR